MLKEVLVFILLCTTVQRSFVSEQLVFSPRFAPQIDPRGVSRLRICRPVTNKLAEWFLWLFRDVFRGLSARPFSQVRGLRRDLQSPVSKNYGYSLRGSSAYEHTKFGV